METQVNKIQMILESLSIKFLIQKKVMISQRGTSQKRKKHFK